jgi:signal transduction histidine kinase
MIDASPLSIALAAALLALWLAAAIWATASGLRRRTRANDVEERLAELQALLAACPATPIVLRPDGRIETTERLVDWLGLPRMPRVLADLGTDAGGLPPEQLSDLTGAVTDAQRSAGRFTREVAVRRSERRLIVQGRPAPAALGSAGTLLLWIFDDTENGRAIADLGGEVDRLTAALDALAALIEAAPIPMWHRRPDLRLTLVNSAYVRAVEGASAGEVISRGLELVEGTNGRSPQAAAAVAQAEGRVMARNVPATIAGARRMLRIVDVPLGASGIAGYAVDVEELEQAHAALARFGRAQRDMLDRLSAGVAQFGPDQALVFFNQPFQRLFAIEPEWLADAPEFNRVLERMREAQRLPESRDFPSWKTERRGWFNAAPEPIEENWLLPGGQHLRVVAQPLPDGGLLLIFEDRTEQLQLASARDTLLRVRTATFDNLFEAIGVFAADGRLRVWNNRFREVWGLEEEILIQHPRVDQFVELVGNRLSNPARAGLIRELVRLATVERQQRSGRVELTDGRHFEFAAVPLPDGNALFTMLDVTDSRRVEAALRSSNEVLADADRVKSAFLSNMSYELRTPLTSIGGFAELLSAGYAGPLTPPQAEYLAAIGTAVERLGVLIDDVLDLSQSEAGDLRLDREPVDLAAIIQEGASPIVAEAEESGVTLSTRTDPSAGTIGADRRRLTRALQNTIRFAVGRARGAVAVRAGGNGAEATIIITDDGPPIDREEQVRLFTRLRHDLGADVSQSLAMPLARRFIEMHGGSIALASDVAGGATITVVLPRAEP